MMIQTIGAFFATIALAIILGVPKKFTALVGSVGAIGWWVYLILGQGEEHIVFRTFIAALVVALVSHSFARLFKSPVTVFLISGILPLVPGTGMYRTVYHFIIGDGSKVSYYFSQTLQLAGVIAIAIFIMDSIFRIIQQKVPMKKKRKES
jgi:uncharacterized membrane protein YjjB (DUF3815 family)